MSYQMLNSYCIVSIPMTVLGGLQFDEDDKDYDEEE